MTGINRLMSAGPVAAGLFTVSAMGAGFQLYTEGSAEAMGQAGAISDTLNSSMSDD